MKNLRSGISFCTLMALFLLAACSSRSDKLAGVWKIEAHIPPSVAAKMTGPVPEGVSMEMSITGTSTYHKVGRFDTQAEMIMRVRAPNGEEMSLTFALDINGEWKIKDDQLVETIQNARVVPTNDLAMQMVRESPGMAESLSPLPGTTASSKIESLDGKDFVLVDEGGVRVTGRKSS